MHYSDVLIAWAYYWALFFMTFVFYVLVFEDTPKNKRYKPPDCYYVVKRLLAIPTIKKLKRRARKIRLLTSEGVQEQPKKFMDERKTNAQVFYGVDSNRNSLFLKMILQKHRLAEVVLSLNVNGEVYTFPNEQRRLFCSTQGQVWQAEGLEVTVLVPFRSIRITFNGLLKNQSTQKVDHVKFSFIWNSIDKPFHYPEDVPTGLIADALAKETWKNGQWIKLLGDEKGYDQYGALQGYVSCNSSADILLYLQAFRKRYSGTNECLSQHREFSIFLIAEDGMAFNVGVKSYKNGCAELKFGSFLDNVGNVFPIDRHDINLEYVGEYNIPSDILFHLSAKKKTYKCVASLMLKNAVMAKGSGCKGWNMSIIPSKFIINTQRATGFVCFWYASHEKDEDLPDSLLSEPTFGIEEKKLVASLDSRESEVMTLAGEKGKHLALASSMTSDYFVVPKGFVILTTAFEAHLESKPSLKDVVGELERARSKEEIMGLCQRLVDLFLSQDIAESVSTAIMDEVQRLSTGQKCSWAVRSSGLSKKQNQKIFLGYLEKDILQAVVSCWSSLFTYESVQWRLENGFGVHAGIAVIVQKMVDPDVSGTVFSCHLTTGDPSQITIKSSYGLGNANESDSDSASVHRTWDENLSITSRKMGAKTFVVEAMGKKASGTVAVETDLEKAKTLALSDDKVLILGRMVLELEKAFGFSCKVEWSFQGDTLFLLQVEALTKMHEWTDRELLNEFNTPLMSKKEMQTTANISEMAPGALTPLTASVVKDFLNRYFYRPFGTNLISLRENRLMINVVNNIFYKNLAESNDYSTFPISLQNIAKKRFPKLSIWNKLKSAFDTEDYYKISQKLINQETDVKNCSTKDTLKAIEKTLNDLNQIGRYYVRAAQRNLAQTSFLLTITSGEGKDDWKLSNFLPLSSHFKLMHELKSVSNVIHQSDLGKDFIKTRAGNGFEWLKMNCPDGYGMLSKFLSKYGALGVRELELECSQTWKNNREAIIEELQFQCMLKHSTFSNKRSFVQKTKAQSKYIMRKLLAFFTKTCRESLVQRKKIEWLILNHLNVVKEMLADLSVKMVEERFVTDSKLVYYLSWYELKNLVETCRNEVLPKAIRRQQLYPLWDKMLVPTFTKVVESNGRHVKGVFIGDGGTVQGRACVVRNISEIKQLLPGDILIMISTNVNWEPYFSKISALVTETNGFFSSGLTVAQERGGFPCMVGAQNATLMFKTGNTVMLSRENSCLVLLS